MEPIAIVGMSCRFPQARSLDAFWRLLRDGVDAIGEVPSDRWDLAEFYDPDPAKPGKMYSRWGGFLEKVDEFDAQFFGISPREAAYMDPQQRLLLEVAWEALEDAGAVQDRLAGTKAGVFVGISTYDYAGLHLSDPRLIADGYANTGGALSIAANRISYLFDLRGPSVAVDTACSSSLAAAHLACQSLWSGESSLALAGGVNVILAPATSIGFSKLRAMSPDGHCKAFDSRADGYVRGEGAAVVVLKPLSRALADGDRIYAVVRGTAMNQDGRTNGLTAPNGLSQEALIRQALASAGIAPARVGYVEAHGTGTPLGDPIEMNALGAALADGRPKELRCAVGSVKTNIGHLEAAAGVAGLVKVALALQHGEIPASLHFLAPNPHIPFDSLPLRVQQQHGPWPDELRPAVAGVSSFGFGGTNVHLVLEEAPAPLPVPDGHVAESDAPASFVVPLSARSTEALQALARSYSEFLTPPADSGAASGEGPNKALDDLAYTASVRRTHHEHRLAVVARSPQELREHLDAFVAGESRPGVSSGRAVHGRRRKLVFVFPGQGGQWLGMGRGLLKEEPVFRAALEQCERAIRPYVGWSLLEELHADAGRSRLDAIDVIHPALWAMQIGLAALWRSWGVEPDAVVGHSMGEIAGAHVAGALTLDDAARVICRRSALLRGESGRGAMAGVELSIEEAHRALAGYEDRVSIAVSNSPTFTVLSGDPDAVAEILASLQARDVFCRPIKGVDVASHSFHMDHLEPELLRVLKGIKPRTPAVPVYSTVAGAAMGGLAFDGEYWARNLREPVLFARAVESLVADGHSVFLEVSPHPVLLPAVQQGLQHLGKQGTLVASARREEDERTVMLAGLGTLFTLGAPVEWSALYPSGGRPERLPSYAWQRERFWLETPKARARAPWSGHPHLRHHVQSAAQGTHFWEVDLDVEAFPYLADHRLQGAIVLPAATYVEVALAAAREVFGPDASLENVEFQKALVLPEKGAQNAQLILSPAMPGTATFQFFTVPTGGATATAPPVLHAAGTIRLGGPASLGAPAEAPTPAQIESRCTESAGVAEHYADARKRGMQYGGSFQAIEQIRRRDGEAIATLRMPEDLRSEAASYRVHPALLDNCFQVLAAAFPARARADGPADPYVPIGMASLWMDGQLDPAGGLFGHALLHEGSATDGTVLGDVFLLDQTGRVAMAARGLRLKRLDARGDGSAALARDEWFQELRWISSARAAPPARTDPETAGAWLVFTDGAGVGESLCALLGASGDNCIAVTRGEAYLATGPDRYVIDPRRPEHYEQLVQDALGGGLPPRGVVHLWSLDAAPPDRTTLETLDAACDLGSASVLHVVQALASAPWREKPRLWLVTSGAQPVASGSGTDLLAVAQSPLWGLARTIGLEHPELRCVSVDLGAARPEDAAALFAEIRAGDREPQVALRGDERYVARLAHCAAEILDPDDTSGHDEVVASPGQPFRLQRSAAGTLEGLRLRAITRTKPGRGEVEIEVGVAGLNFPDVLLALGVLPPLPDGSSPLGLECAGIVTAVGEGVDGLAVGDEVVALATSSLASHVIAYAGFVHLRPPQLSPEQAATLPAVFLTAFYSLNHLARLARGERVLIHSASGGVGLAAVQLARAVGAEVFVTAGSEEKRAYLRSLGLERVADSRSLTFADQVREWTGGEGVDVVLNSLPGEALARGLSLLRPGGRFIELGKRDILRNSPLAMELFRNNRSFFAVDVLGLCRDRPELSASLLAEFWRYFAAHGLEALPHRVFAASEAEAAFRFMAQAKHIGKVLLAMRDEQAKVVSARESPGIRAEATYLVTGGLGGLGLAVAQWLVAQGARHLVLLGRSAPASAAQAVLDGLEERGAHAVVARADVADSGQLAAVLADAARDMPPLRGIVHAAGRLDDGILLQLDAERLASVMAPKVAGAWNLHTLTLGQPLDFFIFFSSAAAVLGSPGQGNYAAANAFMDALAHHRRSRGLPALSINWGPWSEVGLAVRPDRGGRLASFGMDSLSPREGLAALSRLGGVGAAQVSVMPVSPDGWRQLSSAMGNPPVLADLVQEAGVGAADASPRGRKLSAAMVLSAPAAERQAIVEAHLRGEVARVLGLSAARLDVHRPLNMMGIDSLMAVELKNRVEADLGVTLPLIRLIQGPSVAELAELLVEQLGGGEKGAPFPSPAPAPPPVRARSDSLLLSLLSLAQDDRGA